MTATTFETIVTETAQLAPIFRVILTDPQVDPRRLSKAATLYEMVERTARPNVWLVPSATDASKAYTVTHGLCSCRDAQNRDARRCCHALAVKIFEMSERSETDAEQADDPDAYYCVLCEEPIPAAEVVETRWGFMHERCAASEPLEGIAPTAPLPIRPRGSAAEYARMEEELFPGGDAA